MDLPSSAGVLLLSAVSLPFVCSILILILRKIPYSQEVVTLSSSCVLFPILWHLYSVFSKDQGGGGFRYQLTSALWVTLEPEAMGIVFSLLVSLLWLITNIYTVSYMRKTEKKGQLSLFYACFAASIGCTLCIAFAGNIVTIFAAYEVLTLCTCPLIVHGMRADSIEAGKSYLKVLLCSSMLFFLPAVVIISFISESSGLFAAKDFLSETHSHLIPLIMVLLCHGVAKAAIMPLHTWLPRAMVAPTPVSALLHAVAVVKSGVFTIIKITVCTLGIQGMHAYYNGTHGVFPSQCNVLMYLSGITMIAGSLIALRQTSLKRLLAYSTISQLSYITLAISMYTNGAVKAAIFQMVCHAFAKITLFFSVGAIYVSTKKTSISDIEGIGKVMPVTMFAFCIGSLAMIGIPPTATFWSKLSILSEAVQQNNMFVILVIITSTLLNTLYLVPIVYKAFFCGKPGTKISEAPLPMVVAMLATSACTVIQFFKPDIVFNMLEALRLAN